MTSRAQAHDPTARQRAILLVKTDVGLIAPMGGGPGAELDLALIAAMAAVATVGPGSLSIDRNAGLEGRVG